MTTARREWRLDPFPLPVPSNLIWIVPLVPPMVQAHVTTPRRFDSPFAWVTVRRRNENVPLSAPAGKPGAVVSPMVLPSAARVDVVGRQACQHLRSHLAPSD